jgi:hypothetical protein
MTKRTRDRYEPWALEQTPGRRRGLAPYETTPASAVHDEGGHVHAKVWGAVASTMSRCVAVLDPPPLDRARAPLEATDCPVASLARRADHWRTWRIHFERDSYRLQTLTVHV